MISVIGLEKQEVTGISLGNSSLLHLAQNTVRKKKYIYT